MANYPEPPPFYRLLEGNGTLEPPPIPSTSQQEPVVVFGRPLIAVESPGLPERPVIERPPTSIAEAKQQLSALNRELLFNFIELLTFLVSRPSTYARQLEAVGNVLRNMMAVVGMLRPHQARASLEAIFTAELAEKRAALSDLEASLPAALERLAASVRTLGEEKAGAEAGAAGAAGGEGEDGVGRQAQGQ